MKIMRVLSKVDYSVERRTILSNDNTTTCRVYVNLRVPKRPLYRKDVRDGGKGLFIALHLGILYQEYGRCHRRIILIGVFG